jgi:putative cell wall-binding protein
MRARRPTIPRMLASVMAAVVLTAGGVGLSPPSGAQTAPGDRYDTAALLATEAFPGGADVVLVASGEEFADALAAAPLAASLNAPIVLTRSGSVPAATAAALAELGPADVIVLGGTAAISQGVFNTLAGGPWQATRYAGADRYETAALLATEAFPGGADVVLVASGEGFADALAAAPLAASLNAPIVLTRSGSVPAATAAALAELGPADVIVLGGTAAISQGVFNTLAGGPWQATRYAGADRYETAALLATEAFPGGADVVLVASGEGFADALAAAPLAASLNAPIVLTRSGSVPAATAAALAELGPADVIVLGGTAAISQGVFNTLAGGPWQATRYAGAPAMVTVQVYFANTSLGDPCGQVFPVSRQVAGPAVATGALTELLRGPTAAERAQGYSSWFSESTAGYLNSITVADGVARADFRDFSSIIPGASSSCGSADLLAQLDSTLSQFPTVDRSRYSFDGSEEAFYSFLQLTVPG